LAAIREHGFQVLQVNFSVIDQRALDNGLFALAREMGIGIIGRTPLCFGFLTGQYSADTSFEAQDHRSNWPKEQLRRWADSIGLFQDMIRSHGCTPAQFALRFCLDCDALSTVIPGMLAIPHVEENLKSGEVAPLTADQRKQVAEIYRSHSFYDPSVKDGK
jgi:aryl-alcohol dehydrogenase-like predicted oxidoreductase